MQLQQSHWAQVHMFKFPWAWLWKRLQRYNEDKEIVHAKRLWVAIISKARHALTLRLRMQHSVCILNNITRLKDERDRLEMKRYKFFKKIFLLLPTGWLREIWGFVSKNWRVFKKCKNSSLLYKCPRIFHAMTPGAYC